MKTYGTLTLEHNDHRDPRVGTWVLDVEPHVSLRLKRMFGRVNPRRDGAVELRVTEDTSADLEWFMQRYPLNIDSVTELMLHQSADRFRARQAIAEQIMGGQRLEFARTPAREPRPAQVAAADLCLTTGRLLVADALGGGKSFIGCLLFRHPESLPGLIVCPTHLTRQWVGELALAFPELTAHILTCGTPYDPSKKRSMKGRTPDVLISTYGMMVGWAKHLAGVVRTVIFDEAQELRHHGTIRYDAAALLADRAYFAMELTATPVYNYGGEAYNLIDIIASDALGSRPEFTREWGAEMSNGRVMVGEPRELGSYLRDQRLLLCRTDEELGIDRTKPLRIPQVVDIDDQVMTEETAGLADLAALIMSSTASKEERWRTSGELDWRLRRATGLAKAPFVATFVKLLLESEDKVLLFGWHRDVYDVWQRIFEKADIGFVLYTGSETASGKEKAKQTFVTDPHCRVMMMSLRSGAGLDGLEKVCRVAVFGELDWSPSMHDQCIGRLNRNAQPHQVLAYFLTAETGSDPVIMEVLGIKRGQAEPIRNPDVELFEAVEDTSDRVRRLAAAVLETPAPRPKLTLVK